VPSPASCSRKIPMIYSSLNRLRFIRPSFLDDGLYQNLEELLGLRSAGLTVRLISASHATYRGPQGCRRDSSTARASGQKPTLPSALSLSLADNFPLRRLAAVARE
jgi:hypothetical protein